MCSENSKFHLLANPHSIFTLCSMKEYLVKFSYRLGIERYTKSVTVCADTAELAVKLAEEENIVGVACGFELEDIHAI